MSKLHFLMSFLCCWDPLSAFFSHSNEEKNKQKQQRVLAIDIEGAKIDCSSLFIVPTTSAAQNRLLFFFFAAAIYSTNEENTCH